MHHSLAIGGTLTRADTERLLDACAALHAERDAIAGIHAELGPFRETRAALNELGFSHLVGVSPRPGVGIEPTTS